jgi:hypothetical protein
MSDAGPPAVRMELPVLNSSAPARPKSGPAAYQLLEPYDTGRPCLCSDCPGTFQGWWVVSKSGIRKVKVTRSEHPEKQCSQCGCRYVGNEFHPCPRFEADPRSGIRYQPEQPGSAGVTQLEWYALERLEKLFPGIGANEMFLVAREINLFLDLQALFPEAKPGRLVELRQSSVVPAVCPGCGQPVAMSAPLHATYGRPEKQPAGETATSAVELNQTARPRQVNQPDHLSLF